MKVACPIPGQRVAKRKIQPWRQKQTVRQMEHETSMCLELKKCYLFNDIVTAYININIYIYYIYIAYVCFRKRIEKKSESPRVIFAASPTASIGRRGEDMVRRGDGEADMADKCGKQDPMQRWAAGLRRYIRFGS